MDPLHHAPADRATSRFYALHQYRAQLRASGILKSLSQSAAVVLVALADFADADGFCWPSIERLAAENPLSERSVQRALRELEDRGLVVREVRPGQTDRIRLDIEGCHGVRGAKLTSPRGAIVALRGANMSPQGCHKVTLTEQVTEQRREQRPAPAREVTDVVVVSSHSEETGLTAELVANLEAKGIGAPERLAHHGEERVRRALAMLDRAPGVTNPGGWLSRCLDEGWSNAARPSANPAERREEPNDHAPRMEAIAVSPPPPGTRYVLFPDGRLCEVLEVRQDAVKYAYREYYGSNFVLPVRGWSGVTWIDELPQGATVTPLPAPGGPPLAPDAQRQRDLARIERERQRLGWTGEQLIRKLREAGIVSDVSYGTHT